MARTNRRIYATRRKRSPMQMGGIAHNFMEQNPNFRDVLGGSGTPPFNTGVAGGGNYVPGNMLGSGSGSGNYGPGSMLGSGSGSGGIQSWEDAQTPYFRPGTSSSNRPAGMFSRVRARARRRMSELFGAKTSVPPYLDDSSDSSSSGIGNVGGTYTITKA